MTAAGTLKDQQIETLAATWPEFGWRPTPVLDPFGKLGFSDPTTTTSARLVVEVESESGPWRIDNLFVDPYARG